MEGALAKGPLPAWAPTLGPTLQEPERFSRDAIRSFHEELAEVTERVAGRSFSWPAYDTYRLRTED